MNKDKKWTKNEVEDLKEKLIKIRMLQDFNVVKSKQSLSNLIKELQQ